MDYLTGRERGTSGEGLFSASGTLACLEKRTEEHSAGQPHTTPTSPFGLSSSTKVALYTITVYS